MPSVSLLIPAYNEEKSIVDITRRAVDVLERSGQEYELIVLDDASHDETPDKIRSLAKEYPDKMRTILHEQNQGIARSFEELYRAATKDIVFLISGDGQYPPDALLECLPLLKEHDIVICKRQNKHYTLYRHVISWSFRMLPKLLFGVELYDPGSVKCVKREIIREIPVQSRGVFVEAERLIRAAKRGKSIGCISIPHTPRTAGKARGAKCSLIVQAIADILRLRWDLWIHPKQDLPEERL